MHYVYNFIIFWNILKGFFFIGAEINTYHALIMTKISWIIVKDLLFISAVINTYHALHMLWHILKHSEQFVLYRCSNKYIPCIIYHCKIPFNLSWYTLVDCFKALCLLGSRDYSPHEVTKPWNAFRIISPFWSESAGQHKTSNVDLHVLFLSGWTRCWSTSRVVSVCDAIRLMLHHCKDIQGTSCLFSFSHKHLYFTKTQRRPISFTKEKTQCRNKVYFSWSNEAICELR